jgi:hypothetical protein
MTVIVLPELHVHPIWLKTEPETALIPIHQIQERLESTTADQEGDGREKVEAVADLVKQD